MKNLIVVFIFSINIFNNISYSQSVTLFGGIAVKPEVTLEKGGFGFNLGVGVKTPNNYSKYFAFGFQSSFDYYIGDRNNENNFVNTTIPHSEYIESIQNNFDLNLYGVVHLNPVIRLSLYGGGGINLLSGLKVQHSNVTGIDWNGGNTFTLLPTIITGLQVYPFEKAVFFSFEFNKDKYNYTYLLRFGVKTSSN